VRSNGFQRSLKNVLKLPLRNKITFSTVPEPGDKNSRTAWQATAAPAEDYIATSDREHYFVVYRMRRKRAGSISVTGISGGWKIKELPCFKS